jgi:hypothetical protein
MIQIPDPCSEDFSKMSATERGAFCNKCSIDTYDFRDMSNLEINSIVKESKGVHLCGRMTQDQLLSLNAGFQDWRNQNSRTFQSKFIMALVMVFGLTLFACETEERAMIESVTQIEIPSGQLEFINEDQEITEIDLRDYVADIAIPYDLIVCEVSGEIGYDQQDYLIEGLIKQEPDLRTEVIYAGGIGADRAYISYIEATVPDTVESILAPPILANPDLFEAKAYPNPTQGESTVALDINEAGQFDIMLYDMNGRMIRNVHSGELPEGRNQFDLDLHDLNSGTYLVRIISKTQSETLKIQKVN